MLRIKRHFLISVLEWGEDFPPMFLRETHNFRINTGWNLPTAKDFEDARIANVSGFVSPKSKYWASGNGDVYEIIPMQPESHSVCNRYDVALRLRLVRRVLICASSFNAKSNNSLIKLRRTFFD